MQYDGVDMLDTLIGKSTVSRKKPIYFARPPDRKNYYGFKNLPDLAIRHGKWKLMCDFDGGRPMLFDIHDDHGEKNNLADKHPDITARMVKEVTSWYKTMPQLK